MILRLVLLWTVMTDSLVPVSAKKKKTPEAKSQEHWYTHCAPNAELYCRKKAEYQPEEMKPEDEQACRDAIVKACRTKKFTDWQTIKALAGDTRDAEKKRNEECYSSGARCNDLYGNMEASREKEALMEDCISDATERCHIKVHADVMQKGHLKLLIREHGHPKGEGFDHNDEL